MINYLIRRILYTIPVLIGVNLITFLLFFAVNTPDDIARSHLGQKHVTQMDIARWKHAYGYDYPLFYNSEDTGLQKITQTLFYQKSFKLFSFNFGESDGGRNIGYDISQRMWPSLALAIPTLIFGLLINIVLALMLVLFRGSYLETSGNIILVMMMSVSTLFYIITGQFVAAKVLKLVPFSGYDTGFDAAKFLILPVFVALISGVGVGTRWYKTIFLEEISKDYVRTARSKGLSEVRVLFHHVLKNAMIPILTGVVVIIPTLFMGSLLLESFFGIPGLGNYMIEAIKQQDFAIVRSMVFLGSLLYIVGLVMTDISYTLVDPRVSLE